MATTVIDTRAGNEVPMKAIKGESWQVQFDALTPTGQPIDLSDATVTIIGKKKAKDSDSTAPMILTASDGLTIAGTGNNQIKTNKPMPLEGENVYKVIVEKPAYTTYLYFGSLSVEVR
jgi:hypothetical protein